MDIATLITQGGDARIAIDPYTGVNQYFCPPLATPDLICFSSCTASPLSKRGLRAVLACAPSAATITARIAAFFGIGDLAQILLCESGTDATALAMKLIAAQYSGEPLVSVTASSSETGSGVPWAASGRVFLGPAKGDLLPGFSPRNLAVSIALREADGTPRQNAARALLTAARCAPGKPVLHLIDGTKTGLSLMPRVPPGTEVIVDACQGRIAPARVRLYLERGWPVLITGSKFYGGPAFSGALFWPKTRPQPLAQPAPSNGLLLRWTAALAEMEALAAIGDEELTRRMRHLGAAIASRIDATPGLKPLPTTSTGEGGWQSLPSIFSITLCNEHGPLDTQALRKFHRRLSLQGVLLGQPVAISPQCAALRIAIGARDLIEPPSDTTLNRVFSALMPARELAMT